MFSSLPPLVFLCLGGKVAQYGVEKKKSPSWKGRESTPFTISVSRFTLLEKKKKKETILLEADVDTASLSKMERVHPVVAVTKGLMGLKVPVMGHLSSCGRTAEAACNPK